MAEGYIMALRQKIGHVPLVVACASVIIYDENKGILLQKRKDNGSWCYHGGSIEPGETAKQAAQRELFEEVGLHAQKMNLYTVASGADQHFKYPNGDEVHIVDTVFTCSDFSGAIQLESSEVSDCQWFYWDELPENINLPTKEPIINFVKEHLTNKSKRNKNVY
ncbi:NUDIX domain-containing protein [Lactococcus hircilactis]|uniref:NUDIX domain-containing protein n=1 Tax=Lactococcus hircilactis TaxID=1494462 RepID=A0A7X1Z7F1_9LACT|nr:NUDIX hydrolase [Lactococcus hircilactis]MQW39170.1 NUDIX domain-containing protein [Lactococcus hircilactis]